MAEENPSYEELKKWQQMSGLPLKKFFHTTGALYKKLGLEEKLSSMTEEEQLRLLASDGLLVKRPLLIGDDFVLAGFQSAETYMDIPCRIDVMRMCRKGRSLHDGWRRWTDECLGRNRRERNV